MFIFKSLNFKHIHLYPMILSDNKITEIFYLVDEFCLSFEKTIQKHLIGNKPKRTPKMSCSEVITIMIFFHLGGFRNMKYFYLYYVQKHMSHLFPNTVSYNRFLELMQNATLPMSIFLKSCCMGEGTGIFFMDSTPIRVGKNKRSSEIRYLLDWLNLVSQLWGISLVLSYISSLTTKESYLIL